MYGSVRGTQERGGNDICIVLVILKSKEGAASKPVTSAVQKYFKLQIFFSQICSEILHATLNTVLK